MREKGKNVKFTLKFELMPEFKMPEFSSISIEKPVLNIEKKDIDESSQRLLEMNKDFTAVDNKTKAIKGDQVVIDFEGFVNNEAFAGGKAENHNLELGSGQFIPGFEDQLIGKKTGDKVDVKVNFPSEYHSADLASKEALFKVTIKEVLRGKISKLDDDFAKKINFKNKQDLLSNLEKQLKKAYDAPVRTILKMRLFDQLEDLLKFEIPQTLFKREFDI